MGEGDEQWTVLEKLHKVRLLVVRLRVGQGTARAEDVQGTPARRNISPIILAY